MYHVNPVGKALKMQNKKLHIKVILLKVDACTFLKSGIEKELNNYRFFQIEIEYIIIPYSEVEQQIQALQLCIEQQIDGIILNPINVVEVAQKINECKQNNIPVITVNTDIKDSERLCFVGQDGWKAGRVAGRLMGEFLQGKGNVIIFTSDGDNHQTFPFGTREEGFRKIISEMYPNLTLMSSIYTQEKPQVIRKEMRKICESKLHFSGIFITCGGVKAIGDVLEDYECQNIKLVCYENYPEIMELIERNMVTATLDSEIERQSEKAFKILMDYLIYGNKPEKKHFYTETKVLLKESL